MKTIFSPAINVEKFMTERSRTVVRFVLLGVLIVFLVPILMLALPENINPIASFTNTFFNQIISLILLVSIPLIFFIIIDTMYMSIRFRNSNLSYDVARVTEFTSPDDITAGFINSDIGFHTINRLGIFGEDINEYLSSERVKITSDSFSITPNQDGYVGFVEYGLSLYNSDKTFLEFLRKHSITEDLFKGALAWVSRNSYTYYNNKRWWTKDKFERMPSLGKNISFGQTYLLDKYGHSIYEDSAYLGLGEKYKIHDSYVNTIENVLVKDQGANAILVSESVSIGKEIVASFAKDIINGITLPALENKRIFVLDAPAIVDTIPNKAEVEKIFIKILNQATKAGNVIILIPDIVSFIESAAVLGASVSKILTDALTAPNLQVIAISESTRFHGSIENNIDLMRHFETVVVHDIDSDGAIQFIEQEVLKAESRHGILFTYPSLVAFVESSKRYFSSALLSDKVIDLLNEIIPTIKSKGIKIVRASHIYDLVEAKTGIPLGEVTDSERDMLANLEKILHERVVGQSHAINQIATALRRSRAGITNENRPLGSFLFIGPTGVGKTETTKALAEIYFKENANLIRFDMSEFTGSDALSKLIGSYDTKDPGILTSKIKENQYGVLLLDEFEKATTQVHDLFLQIIDEGEFTDGRGVKVNAKNILIIATSNAGSDLVFDAVNKGINLVKHKNEIVNSIIDRGIFKPELLNRFDGVVLFHTLSVDHLRQIAGLMIGKLNNRLKNKAIVVNTSEDLMSYLIEKGNNAKFGAREMNRVIQDEVESMIADAIIQGSIRAGDTINLTKDQSGSLVVNKV
jgi:ATP-dependent Clp protease ATP-binding subunit ClpC